MNKLLVSMTLLVVFMTVWVGAFWLGRSSVEAPDPIRIHILHFGGKIERMKSGMLLVTLPGNGLQVKEGDFYKFEPGFMQSDSSGTAKAWVRYWRKVNVDTTGRRVNKVTIRLGEDEVRYDNQREDTTSRQEDAPQMIIFHGPRTIPWVDRPLGNAWDLKPSYATGDTVHR